ncbi:MAG: hypothetical protein ACRD4Y_12015, partial [Candidatus Acidiferrales bacterium]
MSKRSRKLAMTVAISAAGAVALLASHILFAGQAKSMARKSPLLEPVPALTPFADGHTHFDEKNVPASIQAALAARGRENAAMILFLMSPDTFDHPGHYEAEIILPEAKKYPGKIAVVGGGGSLNAMII